MKNLMVGLVIIFTTFLLVSCSKPTYTVSFDVNGGTPKIELQKIETGGLVIKPSVEPTKEGFIFKYWTKDNIEYNFSSQVNSDFILKAKWDVIKEEEPVIEYITAVIQYDGEPDMFSFDETTNNAEYIGLDESIFNVTGTVITNLPIGLNKVGGLRLYSNHQTGIGNTLTVSIADGYEIAEVIFEFGEGNRYPKTADLILGDVKTPLGAEDIKNTVLTKSDLTIDEFSLQNTHKSDRSAQIWLNTVTIKYMIK